MKWACEYVSDTHKFYITKTARTISVLGYERRNAVRGPFWIANNLLIIAPILTKSALIESPEFQLSTGAGFVEIEATWKKYGRLKIVLRKRDFGHTH